MQKSKQFSVKKANKFPEYHIFIVVIIYLVNTLNATLLHLHPNSLCNLIVH